MRNANGIIVFLTVWAAEIRASSGTSVDADCLEHAATALAAKDAEIAKLREALEKIEKAPAWGAPDKWEPTPAEVRQIARDALKETI